MKIPQPIQKKRRLFRKTRAWEKSRKRKRRKRVPHFQEETKKSGRSFMENRGVPRYTAVAWAEQEAQMP